ncbi:uncharacterized protein LOC107362097 [Tetranychus urticae]|uniref:uncharacterized protein LOC107362097 n=1 Tax=Tetranychus urticae TaxID=32264 RepID=UPI00077BD6F5|nr:uncharacterized protein LOC107362097 [Tetranychus urticae]
MRNLSSFFILTLVSFVTCNLIELLDDGPVTIDSPITFTVKNSYNTTAPSYEYRFTFPRWPKYNKIIQSTASEVNYTVIFESSSPEDAGYYMKKVEVWFCHLGRPLHRIGFDFTSFLLFNHLTGRIAIHIDGSPTEYFVSTALPVNMTAEISHRSGFFDSANKTYKWTVNGSPQEGSYDEFIVRNFSEPQLNNISVLVSVSKTNPVFQKTAYFTLTLHSKDPIHNLTTDSQNNIQLFKDENLQLNVKINGGTPPFFYCWEITNSSTPRETMKPLSESFLWSRFSEEEDWPSKCNKTDESSFNINSHFDEAGNKTLYIDVNNYVSTSTKIITISVHERELLRQPEANKPAVIQETSNIMEKYKPVMLSSEPEIYE